MDSFRLRSMIHDSVHRHVSSEACKSKTVPRDFSTFRRALSRAAGEASSSKTFGALFESNDSDIFTPVWDAWCHFDAELKECRDESEATETWREAVEFYTGDLVAVILERSGLRGDPVIVGQLTESIVQRLVKR